VLLEEVLQKHDVLRKIQSLKGILAWVKYSFQRWGRRIATHDSLDLSVLEIIERDA
jgi:hypothetical protein